MTVKNTRTKAIDQREITRCTFVKGNVFWKTFLTDGLKGENFIFAEMENKSKKTRLTLACQYHAKILNQII